MKPNQQKGKNMPKQLASLKEEWKKKFEGFDFYLLPTFVKRVIGEDKTGMKFKGMALNPDELWSFISKAFKEQKKEIRKMIEGSESPSDTEAPEEEGYYDAGYERAKSDILKHL